MAYNTVQWKHFDNDDRRYEAYVLIDESDGAIIYNYQVWPGDFWLDILNDAIDDAREEQRHNKYGSYGVYGCINNEYDESTRVFITNGLNESINEGRLQGYPIPGYRAAYNPADFDGVDIDITKIDERERILKRAEKMITTEYFPVPDNRTRIRLSDDWSIILSNTLFNNTTEFMGALSISLGYKNDKEYRYENGRLYKDYNDMLDVIERVINRVNNGYFEPYIYDKVDKMDDIRYSDRSYKNVKYYDAVDESIKSNKNDKALLESLIMKYGKDGVNNAIVRLIE